MFRVIISRRKYRTKAVLFFIGFVLFLFIHYFNDNSTFDYLAPWPKSVYLLKEQYADSQMSVVHENITDEKESSRNVMQESKGINSTYRKQSNKTTSQYERRLYRENAAQIGKGFVNIHIWSQICAQNVHSFKLHPRFPFAPEKRSFLTQLETNWKVWNYGQRIFGYLHPPETGNYNLSLESKRAAQLWIGKRRNKVELLASTANLNESFGGTAVIFFDKELSYYFEILHSAIENTTAQSDNLKVNWLIPSKHKLEVIGKEFISFAFNDTDVHPFDTFHDQRIPISNACLTTIPLIPLMVNYTRYPHTRSTGWLNSTELEDVFIHCGYKPEKISPRHIPVKLYGGVLHVVPLWIYPAYNTDTVFNANFASKKYAEGIVGIYMDGLKKKFGSKYSLQEIVRVESRNETGRDVKHLIELELSVEGQQQRVVLSEYVYSRKQSKELCYPGLDHQWSSTVPIYFIITSKQQGFWLRYLIKNMERIYKETKDQNLHWIFYDFASTDIDLESELKNSSLPPRWQLISDKGNWYKTFALNSAVKAVPNPHSIIFTLDLHINFPTSIVDDIRKHCIEHYSVYTPYILRLLCGSHCTPKPSAYWENSGYGLLGIYKSDWDLIGGMDQNKYKYNWGGEDWEVMDRIVAAGLQFEHLPAADTYHYFHKKSGLWNNQKPMKEFE